MTVRVLMADDQAPFFRAAARSVLSATTEFQLVGEATSGEEAVALVRMLRPDLVLMDIKMASIGGIDAHNLPRPASSSPSTFAKSRRFKALLEPCSVPQPDQLRGGKCACRVVFCWNHDKASVGAHSPARRNRPRSHVVAARPLLQTRDACVSWHSPES